MYLILFVLCALFPLSSFCAAPAKRFDSSLTAPRAMPKPPRKLSTTPLAKPLIVLDPGHGGNDEGAKSSTVMEKKITLTTAFLTKKHLEDLGYRVILTRSRDTYISLPGRANIANKNESDLFVSIHFNAAKNSAAKGIEVFYYNQEKSKRTQYSRQLANNILYFLLDGTEAISRGVKKGNHHVTRETQMPAVMVEGGFITNPDERDHLKDRAYLDKIADGIAKGVDKYLKDNT